MLLNQLPEQIYTNGILEIPDGTFKGKVFIISLLLLVSLYFTLRAYMNWKLIDRIHERAGTEEVQKHVRKRMKEEERRQEENKEILMEREFRKKANKRAKKGLRDELH